MTDVSKNVNIVRDGTNRANIVKSPVVMMSIEIALQMVD